VSREFRIAVNRKVAVVLLVILAAAGAIALFLAAPGRPRSGPIVLDSGGASAALFRPETTLRNVTRETVAYSVKPAGSPRAPMSRSLKEGAVDRFATDEALEVVFRNRSREVRYTIHPGLPYSFRYNDKDDVFIYPGAHGREDAADLAPFVPTPMPVVQKMLEMARVDKDDILYDIGCGDGRIVIAAAKSYGARGVGIDIDAKLIEDCEAAAKREGVEALTRFIRMDATKARFSEATVVAVYLLPESLELLRPQFESQLPAGVLVVSHNYAIPGWDDRLIRTESITDENGRKHRVLLYEK
jgi:SAM-dependent methyltransferase